MLEIVNGGIAPRVRGSLGLVGSAAAGGWHLGGAPAGASLPRAGRRPVSEAVTVAAGAGGGSLGCWSLERVRQAYMAMAAQYIDLFDGCGGMHADDLALITRHLSVRSGTVLDLGCGPGHLTAHLRSLGVDASGVDLVPELLHHARLAHPECRYVLGSMHRLPVADESIGGILCWYSLIHLRPDDLDGVLLELRRVLAADGTLVVGFFDGDDVVAFEHKVVTAWYWPVDDLADRLRRIGFAEVERQQRPGRDESGHRPHAALVATLGRSASAGVHA